MPKRFPFFLAAGPIDEGAVVTLDEAERRHARVRRLRVGSRVRVIDGEGSQGSGVIQRIDSSACVIRVESVERAHASRAPSRSVDLFVPAIRLPRLSWLVEKAAELGAGHVTIVSSARAQGERIDAAGHARERLGRIAREAAKQSGQSVVTAIAGPILSGDVTAVARAYSRRLILDRSGDAFPAAMSGSVALWIGPEGGWSEGERATAETEGWNCVRLPGATLRSETAAIAGLVLALQAIDTAERLDGQ